MKTRAMIFSLCLLAQCAEALLFAGIASLALAGCATPPKNNPQVFQAQGAINFPAPR